MELLAGAPGRLPLAHLPTPLWRNDALDAWMGCEVWVKRDDMTGGADAGNKLRKLEYLLAEAKLRGSTIILTCGAVQSNHARATALAACEHGMRSRLFLRTAKGGDDHRPVVGNLFIDQLIGAEVQFISPEQYEDRDALMSAVAEALVAQGERPYVIPEGGSNGLGTLGYVECMAEIRRQLDFGLAGGPEPFDAIVSACGSGGTSAGLQLGAGAFKIAPRVHAVMVGGKRSYFEKKIQECRAEAQELVPVLSAPEGEVGAPMAELVIHDEFKGPAYGVPTKEQLEFIVLLARRTGLVLDPVYTGKAMFALSELPDKPKRVLFIHTGGLPGLLAESARFQGAL